MLGEAGSAPAEEAEKYKVKFRGIIDKHEYHRDQVFNADETGLFWKKLPNTTYITKGMKHVPGRKIVKDRLTLLLCANASGTCPLKPLLIYHSENPRAFTKKNSKGQKTETIMKKLPVIWKSNKKAWMNVQLFTDWVNNHFAPRVAEFLAKQGRPKKALLVLDNAPAHPSKHILLTEENKWIKVDIHALPFRLLQYSL
jgi:hypothetical protein